MNLESPWEEELELEHSGAVVPCRHSGTLCGGNCKIHVAFECGAAEGHSIVFWPQGGHSIGFIVWHYIIGRAI